MPRIASVKPNAKARNAESAERVVAVIGIDIGKYSFHIVGLDRRGRIVIRQEWSRSQVEMRLATPRAWSAWRRVSALIIWRASSPLSVTKRG